MLYATAAILFVLWVIGYFGFQLWGNYIHILLALAVIAALVRVVRGDEPLKHKHL